MEKIEGLIAATFSTFKVDGSLDLEIIPPLVDKLVGDGLKGVFICGTNGEGPNMTINERMAVAEAYIRAAAKRLSVLVHVGHNSIEESRKLAAHAEETGADAISAVAGFYFKPESVSNLVESIAHIAAAAPNIPFYYYHIPTLTGVTMDMLEFLRLGEASIPNLVGIKYTASTLHEFQACLDYKDKKFDMLFGYDELLLPALAVGTNGAIGSTYTFAAPLFRQVIACFRAGKIEEARDKQRLMIEVINRILKYPPIPAQKAVMGMLGYQMGPCRLPLRSLRKDEVRELKSALESIGFFEAVRKPMEVL